VTFRSRSRPVEHKTAPPTRDGLGKRERNRRLAGLGLSYHDDEAIQKAALAIIERFRRWTIARPSALSGLQPGQTFMADGVEWIVGRIDPAHQDSRGSFGCDIGNVLPLTDYEHDRSHRNPDYLAANGMPSPMRLARTYGLRFLSEYPKDAAWIIEHANDGDVIALAKEAVL
jgi:hypothetical protein